jgi:hypothetical protein
VDSSDTPGGRSVTNEFSLDLFGVSPLTPSLLYTHLPTTLDVCGSPDEQHIITQSLVFWAMGFDPRQGQRIFPLTSVSRPALGPTQPPAQWVPGVLSPGQSAATE